MPGLRLEPALVGQVADRVGVAVVADVLVAALLRDASGLRDGSGPGATYLLRLRTEWGRWW